MTDTAARNQGKHKIYLGYAAGVGKTFQMLEDARLLLRQGADVVIGYLEPHGRKDTIEKAEGLEILPRRQISYRGANFEEMDMDAVLRRRPQICLVDELAHSNIPGSSRAKRWEDVRELLDAGIDVWSTVNVQHLESLNDQIWQLTGVRVRETLPDWIVDEADQVVMVDLTARALLNRLERGVVYPPERAREAMKNFFTEQNLSALRDLALRHAAHEVEEKLPAQSSALLSQDQAGRECVLICLDEEPATAAAIRRGKRIADYLLGRCLALYVLPDLRWDRLEHDAREAVEKHLSFACNLRIETHVMDGKDIALTIAQFARAQHVTQIFMRRSRPPAWGQWLRSSTLHRVVHLTRDMEVTIVADRRRKCAVPARHP